MAQYIKILLPFLFLALVSADYLRSEISFSSNSESRDSILSGELCPLTDDVRIVYSLVNGVGPASKIWVEDLLWWWQQADPSLRYTAVDAAALQHCDLASFPNLRVYINPGGDAYSQLGDMGAAGADNIKRFVYRDQRWPSAYVGFCAGGYIAAHDYLWESVYEGVDYYDYQHNPPLSIFPHTVEGSIVDINDDQYADQFGSKFRTVNSMCCYC